ncbi:MAG: polysaccharide biosynthesis tyrosine autokinase [Bacteroidales bacterium]|nr:polysaccharide biosynthesis tyrosine autokinase [Bacteroidales bacterium]
MDNNNTYNRPDTSSQEDNNLSLKDIWALCVNHWKWFAISLAVCLLAATYYVLTTVPVYTRSASVLIKEDRRSGSVSSDISGAFADLGFGQTRVNVNNEIINFLSPDLMQQVVKNLHLDVDYKVKGRRYKYTIYGSSLPVQVEFLDLGRNESAGLKLNLKDSSTFVLSDFTLRGDKVKGKKVTMAFDDTTDTPLGKILVTPTQYADQAKWDKPIFVNRSGFQATSRRYRSRLSATLSDKNTTVINLGFKDVNTQRAEDVLRMVINVYNENWIKDKNQITTSTNEFIADRLRVIEQELGSVDKTITSYRSEHRIPDYSAAARMDMELSAEAGKHLMELNNQLSIARFLQSDISSAAPGTLLPANVGINDASTQGQINQYNTTMLQRNRLVESSSEENLLVKDLDQQLASLRSSILTSLDNYIKSIGIQIRSSQQAQRSSQARVSDIPLQAGRLLSDERQQKVKEALYLYLLQKREENELSQAFTAYNTRVIASPSGSNAPIAPNKKMIYLVALLLGLAIPFAWFYLKEVLNTSVRGRKDLENMSAPFLGELPSIYEKKNIFDHIRITDNPEDRKIVVKPHSRNVINEAFRVVRTNLEFMRGKDPGSKVLMVTSFNVGSGKTFVSANLATALAIKGKKTVILDLDLRKRSLSELAGQPKKGLSDWLGGQADDWQSLVVHQVGGNNLDVLPVGTMPPNPAELLAEPRLATLLTELRDSYDYIFLDCPPIEIVTDADLIAPLADITLFVVRAGLLERSMLGQVEKYYTSKKYNNMALLLNGTESAGRYGYKYGYKYGYAYGKYGSSYGSYGSEKDA